MRVLALEPYYGGSHKAFLDEWRSWSRHEWTVLSLPAAKWRWRMRHAPLTLAEQARERVAAGDSWDVLFCSDVAVSTADHEFFGIAMVEAAAAGAYPLVPRRLAYPEVFASDTAADGDAFFYEGRPGTLAARLAELAGRLADGDLWRGDSDRGRRCVARFKASVVARELDDCIAGLTA